MWAACIPPGVYGGKSILLSILASRSHLCALVHGLSSLFHLEIYPSHLMILFAAKKNLVMDLYDLLDTNFTLDFEMIG